MIFFGWGRLGGPAALIGGGFAMIVRQFCKNWRDFCCPKEIAYRQPGKIAPGMLLCIPHCVPFA
jgi:hypothetical protein